MEYIQHKVSLVHSIFGGKRPKIGFGSSFLKVTGKVYQQCTATKTDRYFNILRKVLYPKGKKSLSRKMLNYLNPQALALWYMDDGSLKACHKKCDGKISSISLSISTYCTREEAEIIQLYFKETWDIAFNLAYHSGCKSYYMRAGTKEANKFIELIRKYIIPSMLYKIDPYLLNSQKARVPSPHKRINNWGEDIVHTT